jgi:hypothetical protein
MRPQRSQPSEPLRATLSERLEPSARASLRQLRARAPRQPPLPPPPSERERLIALGLLIPRQGSEVSP